MVMTDQQRLNASSVDILKQKLVGPARTIDVTTKFLQHCPTGLTWFERRSKLWLEPIKHYEKALDAVTDLSATSICPSHKDDVIKLIELAKIFATPVESLPPELPQVSISSFRLLISLSICRILQAWNSTDDELDAILQRISPSRQTRNRLLKKGITWVIRLINGLMGRGWTMERANELLFISICIYYPP